MNRHVAAGILTLALAGCAQDRSVVSKPRAPVEMTPAMPSIYETINGENPGVNPESIRAGHPVAAPVVARATKPTSRPTAAAVTSTPEAVKDAELPKPVDAVASPTPESTSEPRGAQVAEVPAITTAGPAAATVPVTAQPTGILATPLPEPVAETPLPQPAPNPPTAQVSQPVPEPQAAAQPEVAVAETPVTEGRPAPFAGMRGQERPRLGDVQPVPAAPLPVPAVSPETVQTAAEAPLPVPAVEPGNDLPPAIVPESTPEPAPIPTQAPQPAVAPAPAAIAPMEPAPVTSGRVRIPVPIEPTSEPLAIPTSAVPPAPASADTSTVGRDPLLGANPDIMPAAALPPTQAVAKPVEAVIVPAPSVAPAVAPAPVEPAMAAAPAQPAIAAAPVEPAVAPAPPVENPTAIEPTAPESGSDPFTTPVTNAPGALGVPLLGANPEIMPPVNRPAVPAASKPPEPAVPVAPPEIPNTLPLAIEPVGSPTAANVAPTEPQAPPVVRLSPPTDLEPPRDAATVPVSTPAPASAVAPAPSRDPLLGADPDIMPAAVLPSAGSTVPPSTRSVPIPSNGGNPPSVAEMTGVVASQSPTALLAQVDPSQASLGGVVESPSLSAGANLGSVSPAQGNSGQLSSTTQGFPGVTIVRPDSAVANRPTPTVIDLRPPAPVSPPAPAPKQVPAAKPAPVPVAKPAPAPAPVVKPAPAPAPPPRKNDDIGDPVVLPPIADQEVSRDSRPATSGELASRPVSRGFASVPVTAPPEAQKDSAAVKANEEPTAVRSTLTPRSAFEAGKPAARVGDEVITLHELRVRIIDRRKGMGSDQQLTRDMNYMLAKQVLNDLVDRMMVLQEAKRELKDEKKFKKFMEMADRVFDDEELPTLLRQTASTNKYELKQKLIDRGESLEDKMEQFRQEFLSRGFMEQKLGSRMKVELLEMREYYSTHLKDYFLPAETTWREVVVEVSKSKTRAEALGKANALLERLRRGEDFTALAKATTDGPNRSDGGLWKTAPGSYAVPAVNAALESLPLNQVSQVIEGPESFHIIRVEARRNAGPAPFGDVQDKISKIIRRQKVNEESNAYLDKLRKRTIIWTVFDPPPPVTRTSVEVPLKPKANTPVPR